MCSARSAAAVSVAAALFAAPALVTPGAAGAQEGVLSGGYERILVGAHATHAVDAFGGATGAGALLAVDLPLIPVQVRAFGERHLPGCGADARGRELSGCAFWGWGADVLLRLPVPVLAPYVSAGAVYRFLDAGDAYGGSGQLGAAVGGGLHVPLTVPGLAGASLFGEARYELLEIDAADLDAADPGAADPRAPGRLGNQWVVRAGVVVPVL